MPATGTFTAVSVGDVAACAITSTATITCWGNDSNGQISKVPAAGTFTAVSVG